MKIKSTVVKGVLFVTIALVGCQPSTKTNATEEVAEITGTHLSDSTQKELVQSLLPRESPPIDTFETLHQINSPKLKAIEHYQFSLDSIEYYDGQLQPVPESLQKVLYVTHYFTALRQTSHFDSYIFYQQFDESHYYGSFELVVIPRKGNQFDKLTLAVSYGNELQQYEISSQFLNDSTVVRTTHYHFDYIHGVGKVDSTSIEVERFRLSNEGVTLLD